MEEVRKTFVLGSHKRSTCRKTNGSLDAKPKNSRHSRYVSKKEKQREDERICWKRGRSVINLYSDLQVRGFAK